LEALLAQQSNQMAAQMAQMAQMNQAAMMGAMQQASGGQKQGYGGGRDRGGSSGGAHQGVILPRTAPQPQHHSQYSQQDPVEVALHEALLPVSHMDTEWDLPTMQNNVHKCFYKTIVKYTQDERVSMKGSSVQAQALVEEFIENAMSTCAQKCSDREWFTVANFAGPLYAAAQKAFGGTKVFSRVLTPSLQRFVEEGLFRFREEQRLAKAFWEAITSVGLEEKWHKKAYSNLAKSYDSAHAVSPWGLAQGEHAGLNMLQDFTYGWMRDFMHYGWDVLEQGIGQDKEQQIIFVTALFQTLVGPEMRAVPFAIVQMFEEEQGLPPSGWDFVASACQDISEGKHARPERKKIVSWAHWKAPEDRGPPAKKPKTSPW
jgi:hypothetical protein